MRQIMDFILTPEMVEAIKKVEDGMGAQFVDCDWSVQEIGNAEFHEKCYTFTRFKDAVMIPPEKMEVRKPESETDNTESKENA